MIEKVKITEVVANPNNPRVIRDDKFKKLVKSINEFPEMLQLRPIVVNDEMIVLGGNMRLKACKEAGLKEVHIIKASDLSEAQQAEFIIKDNVGFGDWDWDMLANEYDDDELKKWGLDIPKFDSIGDLDYSILDDDDGMGQLLEDLAGGVRKAIQIEFQIEHYEQAQELVKFWRDKKLYIGGFLIEKLKEEKNKIS